MNRGKGLSRTKGLETRKPLEARSELKRTSSLTARSGLQRSASLDNGARLARTGPIAPKPNGCRDNAEAKAWTALRRARYELSEGRCDFCGLALRWDDYECHHRRLTAHGGPDSLENTLALHAGPPRSCHVALVHGGGQASYDHGFLVRAWADPAETPVLRHGRVLVLPTAHGWQPYTPTIEEAS